MGTQVGGLVCVVVGFEVEGIAVGVRLGTKVGTAVGDAEKVLSL